MSRVSLRRRLLWAAALWIALGLAAVGVLLVLLFRHHVEQELAERARGQLDALIAGLVVEPGAAGAARLGLRREPPDPAFHQPLGGMYWLVQGAAGPPLRSRSWWDALPAPALAAQWPKLVPGETGRFTGTGPGAQPLLLWARRVELAGLDAPVVVAVGADVTRLQGLTRSYALTVGAALGVLALALWAAAGLQVRSGLAPLGRLQVALQRLRGGEASRIEGRYPAEVQPLVADLNAVLDHNERLVRQAREQSGNLAHGLKTPLAVIGNAAVHWPGEEGELVRAQLALLQRQVDLHLVRARAAAQSLDASRGAGPGTPVAAVLDDLLRVMERLYAARALRLERELPPQPPRVAVPTETLHELLGNLLDNACQWARWRVRVRVAPQPGAPERVVIEIHDDGPGIAPEQRERALQRGQRLDERQPGSGLGLAIADELAQLHGGRLELEKSPLGGLLARVGLPRR
ncbi:sensor histidine kinase [Azohydromonas caseinilytica]|uniref:histidine kinase n=1 Tax=Azohydromonas caseinilytica TaxID=2728836 RepID=A0A848FJ94_9BURK|nr:sensor histidine kinase [Azohydromonas caseinilytica]NML18379.1 sensor histidine kinase [Azohydromonas caseinilytica]